MEDLFTLTPEPKTSANQKTGGDCPAASCSLSVLHGDARSLAHSIQPESVDLILTSPPYYRQRDYGVDGQIGMEPTVTEYIEELMKVFNGLRNALKSGGNLLINVADSYATSPTGSLGNSMTITGGKRNQEASAKRPTKLGCGVPEKSLFLVPERLGLALLNSGWIVRQTIIWHKPNAMPSSVRDRCHMAHEVVIHATKSKRHFFDASPLDSHEAGGWDECCPDCEGEGCDLCEDTGAFSYDYKQRRSVWTIPTKGQKGDHFARMPEKLAADCILSCCPEGGTVLDPFHGMGTTASVANSLGRNAIGIEINASYLQANSQDKSHGTG
jgi:DNA modification methylase